MNRKMDIVKPTVSKKRVNATNEPKVRASGFHEIFLVESSCRFLENQALRRMVTAKHPRARPEKRGKKPGPGLAKVPIFKSMLFQQANAARDRRNREEIKSFREITDLLLNLELDADWMGSAGQVRSRLWVLEEPFDVLSGNCSKGLS